MEKTTALRQEIKALMVDNLMLQLTASEIGDEQLLFGPGSLGLDSVDALQLVVALDKNYGLKIPDPNTAREVLQSVTSIAEAIARHQAAAAPLPNPQLSRG
jgi:acyl carrier protein